jgi:hypothetical protein
MWLYPDDARVLELSTTCEPAEAFDVAAETRAYLASQGVVVETGHQEAKTRRALDSSARGCETDDQRQPSHRRRLAARRRSLRATRAARRTSHPAVRRFSRRPSIDPRTRPLRRRLRSDREGMDQASTRRLRPARVRAPPLEWWSQALVAYPQHLAVHVRALARPVLCSETRSYFRAEGDVVSEHQFDEMGPIDYIVMEWDGDQPVTGEVMPLLVDLVDRGVIRILDIAMLAKNADGAVSAIDFGDLAEAGDPMADFEGASSGLLGQDDLEEAAVALKPGTLAAVLVWENRWAAPIAVALRRSGGQLVASGRIPVQALIASLDASEPIHQ